MFKLSSIFSFNTLQIKSGDRLKKNVVYFIILFLAISFFYYAIITSQRQWKIVAGKTIADVISVLEYKVNNSSDDQKFVLFLGSSRFHSGIDEETFNLLNKKNDQKIQFVNLAQAGMDIWQSGVILKNANIDFNKIKLVIIEVNPWSFNKNFLNRITKKKDAYEPEFDVWASFQERMEIEDTMTRLLLLSRLYFQRQPLDIYLKYFLKSNPQKTFLERPPQHSDAEKMLKLKQDASFFAENISKSQLNDYQFDSRKVAIFERILTFLKTKNTPVYIVQAPVKREYYNNINSSNNILEFSKHENYLNQLKSSYPILYCKVSTDCRLDDTIFIDYGHFSKEGSQDFSSVIWEEIQPILEKK